MRPLKREGRRSQYCGPSDNPKHTKFCHDRSSVLIITITRCTVRSVLLQPEFPETREQIICGRALPIILVCHVGPCRSDTDGFGCYPTRVADIVGPSGCIPEGPPRVPR